MFTAFTLIMLLVRRDYENLAICIATFGIIFVPAIVEKLFSCRINTVIYLLGLVYTISPMLGDCYKLYYATTWWDKVLHTFGGIVFALFGLYLFEFLNGKKSNVITCAVFALCFSVTLSVIWEFIEFGSDIFLGTDMQHDTVVSSINSYMLGDRLGAAGVIENIHTVTVNGTELPVNGYIDIGLIDSMTDMLLETLGAILVFVIHVFDKGNHPAFVSKTDYQNEILISNSDRVAV